MSRKYINREYKGVEILCVRNNHDTPYSYQFSLDHSNGGSQSYMKYKFKNAKALIDKEKTNE
jgi:hypothetical protein